MAFETALQRVWIPSHFPQDSYLYRNFTSSPNSMNDSAGSNESSGSDRIRNPLSRGSTGPVVMDPRYTANHATEMNSIPPANTLPYGSATKYLLSRSCPSANEFSTNVSSNPNASGTEMGDCIVPTYLNEPDGNLCFEPEAINPFYITPNIDDFNPLIPEWPPLNHSLRTSSSVHDNYSTDLATWTTSVAPWCGTSVDCSVKGASKPQSRYREAVKDKNEIDAQTHFQHNPGQAKDGSTHRCQEIGCDKLFSRAADLKRHHRELHDPGQKRFLCGCCTTKPDGFKREEKLINHKVKFHEFIRGSELRTCPECRGANTLEIFYFCSGDALDCHRRLAHGICSVVPTGGNDSRPGMINANRMQSQSHESGSNTIPPEPSLKCAKRGHQIENENNAKRAKTDPEVHRNKEQRMEIPPNKSLVEDSDSHIDLAKLGHDTANAAAEEILVPDVGISDFFVLSKNKVIRAIVEENIKPDSANGLAKPEISFNAFQGSIRLRGFGNITKALKTIVYELLGKQKRLGSSLNDLTSLSLLCMRPKLPRVPPPQSETRTQIFPMRHTEDAELLRVWHERIIPSLPDLLAKTIGDNYSASLVRKGISEFSGTAVIQIQSHTVPSKTVRALIRNQIVRWVDKDISLRTNQVQFLRGRLTTLAGERHDIHEMKDSPDKSDQGSDDDGEAECYPFYKRYWRTPGPGASIGLLCTRSIAATVCCYVHVDGRLYILTVEHFITKSYDRLLTGTSDRTTVLSPALADIDDMKEKFSQFVTDFKIELDEAMREHFGEEEYPKYVSLSDIGSLPDHVQEIMAKLDVVQKDLSHLTGGDGPFTLGSLAYQSTTPTNSGHPLYSFPKQTFPHHMDWALCSVLPERAGTNRHRYHYDPEERAVDFYTGDTDTFGAGQPFFDTCGVEPNTKVHFVGQATGRQSGEINAALILISQNGIFSQEWSMVMPANGHEGNNTIHRGDSGASILRDSDNKLVGLLWGCTKDGQLVLSPINIVFDDIRQKVQADVSLPPPDRNSTPELALGIAVHEVELICRDKTIERPKPRRQFRSSNMPSPRRKQALISSTPEKFPAGNSQPPVAKTASPPTPLFGPQRPPTFNPPNAIFGPILPAPAYIRLAQQVFRGLEDNKNKHPLGFILAGNSITKLGKRVTFPQTQDRALRRTGTWPVGGHLRLGSHNAGVANAILVN